MCCGQKRSAMRSNPTGPTGRNIPQITTTALRYLENAPIRVRGPVSGKSYEFSASLSVQHVDPRDAPTLLNTRLFRRA